MHSAHNFSTFVTTESSSETSQDSQYIEKIKKVVSEMPRNPQWTQYQPPPRMRQQWNQRNNNDDGYRRRDSEMGLVYAKVHENDSYQSRTWSSSRSKTSPFTRPSYSKSIVRPSSLIDTSHDSDATSVTHQSSSDEASSAGDWYPSSDACDWLGSDPEYPPSSLSWASVPDEKPAIPATVSRRRPCSNEICRNWLAGRCSRTYDCRYVHNDLEYEDPAPPPPYQNKLFSQWSFTVHDHIKVRLGPGLAVESVTTGFETPWIHISGLSPGITTDELTRLLQRYGKVDGVKVFARQPPIVEAKARFSSHNEAQMANTGLNDSVHWGQTLTTRLTLSTGDRRYGDAVISETAVRVRWEAPSKQAYAGYTTLARAQKAIQIAEADYSRTYISGQIHVGLPAVNAHTVRFRNLPIGFQRKSMDKYAKPEDVVWEKVNYMNVDTAATGIRKLLEYKSLSPLKFEVLPPPYRDGYVRAWAQFSTPSAARAAVAALHHYNPLCTGKTRIYADHVHTLSYRIASERYMRALNEAHDLRASLWQRGKRNVTISFIPHESTVTVKLSAHDIKELGELKVELERALEGEVVRVDEQPIWDGYFNGPQATTYFRQLETQHSQVTISEDPRRRRVILFGHPEKRKLVREELLKKHKELNAGERRYFSIPGHLMGPFMRELGPLKRLLGPENVTLDMWNHKLCVRGKLSDYRAAQQALDKIRMPHRMNAMSCPICLGEVERPVTLSCQHSYCRTCLSNYFLAAKDNHFFPLTCLGRNAKCPTPIPLPIARDLLPVADFDALVEAAFTTSTGPLLPERSCSVLRV